MIKNNKIEKVKRFILNREIKKEIKRDLAIDQKISANEVFNFLTEYKKSIRLNKNNREYSEIDKTNMNISILNARLNALGRRNSNKYYNLAIERLENINTFFLQKEEMIYRTKLFLADIEKIPKKEMTYDLNFLKSITVQTAFNVETNFRRIFTELLKKSQNTTNIKEFYALLDISCKRLDDLFIKKKNIYNN